MKTRIFPVIITAALTSILTFFVAAHFQNKVPFLSDNTYHVPVNYTGYNENTMIKSAGPVDFQAAAEGSVKAVVHIQTATKARAVSMQNDPLADDFFGDIFGGKRQFMMPPQKGSGSGVVISPDGYIVTNNHVVENADEITVTFNDRYTTKGKVVATDASTDLALVKVEEKNLPYMEFGNSDDTHLGQWVLAVGFPYSLDATVTAGIVSAKGRALGINHSGTSAIESYIQTDAAVNPGNSGGALVNTNGQLVGINSAIASPTGAYAGYSYAIPSNLVKKVITDLKQYGNVQRGMMGVQIIDRSALTPEKMHDLGIDKTEGVYVDGVTSDGGAAKAGLKKGDFITAINGTAVSSSPELLEHVARYKPGDNINVTYSRSGKSYNTAVLLKAISIGGNEKILGATMRPLTSSERAKYGIEGGVLVTDIGTGTLAKQTKMRKGFVIISINEGAVGTPNDVKQALGMSENTAQIAGFYPGSNNMYYYGLNGIADALKSEQ